MIAAALLLSACHPAVQTTPQAMREPIALEWKAGKPATQAEAASQQARDYYAQGLAYLDSLAWVPAGRSFQEALRLEPGWPMANLRLAEAERGAGLEAEAGARLDHIRAAAGNDARVRLWLEIAVREGGLGQGKAKHRAALRQAYFEALDTLVNRDPRDPRALLARGDAHALAGDALAAIRDYRSAAGLDPQGPGAHHRLAHLLNEHGETEEALRHARAYAQAAPRWPHGGHLLAHILPRAGQWRQAQDALEKAGETDPHATELRAAFRLRSNELAAAEALFDQACRGGLCAGLLRFLQWSGRMNAVLDTAASARSSESQAERCAAETAAGFALTDLWLEGDPRKTLKSAKSMCAGLRRGAAIEVEMLGALIDVRRGKGKKMEPEILRLAREAAELPDWDRWLFFLDYYSRAVLHAGLGETAAEVAAVAGKIDPGFVDRN
ncbi:MAG: hypothetical protein R2762_04255 [Bryobacteraceae bacterium]